MAQHQVDDDLTHTSRLLMEPLPDAVLELMEKINPGQFHDEPLVLHADAALNAPCYMAPPDSPSVIINLERLNDVRFINKFLESVNRALPMGGVFISSISTAYRRKERILKRFPKYLNTFIYSVDFAVHRIWPKLPYLNRIYFKLSNGRDRVIAEMETYGRLYACGFRLIDTVETKDCLFYFAVEKTGEPDYNMEATYGPLIKLRRVCKDGKIKKVYKFRTMSPYSEYIQAFIYERNGYNDGAKFRDDRRITTLGALMRRYWIDELPMLYNWLKGDLKLFGVRPVSVHYFNLFSEEFREYRKKFKPGLIPPVYVEIPNSFDDIEAIERRYLEAYEKQPVLTDIRYTFKALYNIFVKKVRSK